MAITVIHEGDAAMCSKARGLRRNSNVSRWLQLVIREDTELACLNICKKGKTDNVKETVALYGNQTRLTSSFVRDKSVPMGAQTNSGSKDYQFTVTTISSNVEREYAFQIPSLFQLEQWMARLRQVIYTSRNWFSCQQRGQNEHQDNEVLLEINVQSSYLSIIDPLAGIGEPCIAKPHSLLALKEFGAERDQITLYFILCSRCNDEVENIFLRTSSRNANRILDSVERTVAVALGENSVERIPSSRCGYLVYHACMKSPPIVRRGCDTVPPLPTTELVPLPPKRERPRLPFGPPELSHEIGRRRTRPQNEMAKSDICSRGPAPLPPLESSQPLLPSSQTPSNRGSLPSKPLDSSQYQLPPSQAPSNRGGLPSKPLDSSQHLLPPSQAPGNRGSLPPKLIKVSTNDRGAAATFPRNDGNSRIPPTNNKMGQHPQRGVSTFVPDSSASVNHSSPSAAVRRSMSMEEAAPPAVPSTKERPSVSKGSPASPRIPISPVNSFAGAGHVSTPYSKQQTYSGNGALPPTPSPAAGRRLPVTQSSPRTARHAKSAFDSSGGFPQSRGFSPKLSSQQEAEDRPTINWEMNFPPPPPPAELPPPINEFTSHTQGCNRMPLPPGPRIR